MRINSDLPTADDWSLRVDFQRFLETHLSWLQQTQTVIQVTISDAMAELYRADGYALLLAVNIPVSLHHFTLRLNNYRSAAQLPTTGFTLYQLNPEVIERLKRVFKTNKKPI